MNTNLKFKYTSILLLATILVGCSYKEELLQEKQELDYSQSELWFTPSSQEQWQSDIFYILPTCVWDWSREDGSICHYADPYNEEQREAMRPSYELAEDIFAQQSNLYAPYYRQITLESWIEGDSVVVQRFPAAMDDIKDAFDYYIEHKNSNRPFIIAGYSQGAKCVIELLKTMPDTIYSRMIAAYAIGYRISNEEVAQFDNIEPATSATDTGVIISYNSVADAGSICKVLSPTDVCINPINWKTDSEAATMQDSITVHIDSDDSVLFLEGIDRNICFIPELESIFPSGNFHLIELTQYQESLTQNVKDRVDNFR